MRYLPFSQQPYCCVPTCVQMVLHRRGLPLLSQEEIGRDLGLTVPTRDHWMLPGARASDTPPGAAGYGTQVSKREYSLNHFFDVRGYPLSHRFVPPEMFPDDIGAWIRMLIDADADLLCCFNHRALHDSGESCGHVSVLESLEGDTAVLIEPVPNQPKRRPVRLERLVHSMKLHGADNSGGFWVIAAN